MKKVELPKNIPVFPLSNFIIFPKTTVPFNIFEPRYIDMINESMKSNKLIGMIQPLNSNNVDKFEPDLHQIGCLGKITSFKETEDGRYLIELRGLIRFEIMKEINSILYAGILSGGFAFVLQIYAQKNITPAPAAIIFSLEGVFATIAAWYILNQILDINNLLGCLFILCGVLLSQLLPLVKRRYS